jgi:diadenosine tetraphosphatase ApaH/serine/threonine PP2A family protein phosphatase
LKYIIFSDVHSNLEALDGLVEQIKGIEYDKIACLGDIVGYCADPNPTVNWVRRNCDILLAGNHDYAAVGKTDTSYFNSYALTSCEWTKQVLSEKNKTYLASLPIETVNDGIYWVHSSPHEPGEWHYVVSKAKANQHFANFQEPLCFLGHSHRPLILEESPTGTIEIYFNTSFKLKPEHRYIINVGSLGQPRDGNNQPAFVVYDSASGQINFHRFAYDRATTQKKIVANGLPDYLAERLSHGV